MSVRFGQSEYVHVRRACFLTAALLSSCTGDGDGDVAGSTARPSLPGTNASVTTAVAAPTSVAPTATTEFAPSATYCALAAQAVDGSFDFTDPEQVKRLTQSSELTTRQRALIAAGAADAVAEVASGGGWSNDQLVFAVNDVCGLDLVPSTLTP